MTYEAMDFSSLLGMKGFSDDLLTDHFGLYEGYVHHTNELLQKIGQLRKANDLASVEFSELERRLGWEFNGMRLHELYFSNLGGDGASSGELIDRLGEQFGGFDAWSNEFQSVGTMRGVGWAILYHDPLADRFMNLWIDEHHTYHAATCTPLLVMDVWEHAFANDYGTDRESYIAAFVQNVNWDVVESRLAPAESAVTVSRR